MYSLFWQKMKNILINLMIKTHLIKRSCSDFYIVFIDTMDPSEAEWRESYDEWKNDMAEWQQVFDDYQNQPTCN